MEAGRWLWRSLSPFGEMLPLPSTHQQWASLFTVADSGLVLPRLARAVLEVGRVPGEVADFLDGIWQLHELRNAELRAQLLEAIETLNAEGIEPILMKGAAFLFEANSSRVMLDLDIWVPGTERQMRALGALARLGYVMHTAMPERLESQHWPGLFRKDALARIELHGHMVHPRLLRWIDEGAVAAASTEAICGNARFRLMDEDAALVLSYLQCREPIEQRRHGMVMMKSFDLLDRIAARGASVPADIRTLPLPSHEDAVAAQLFTALSRLSGLPYNGPVDSAHLRRWERSFSAPALEKFGWRARSFLVRLVKEGASPRRWKGKRLRHLLWLLWCRLQASRGA